MFLLNNLICGIKKFFEQAPNLRQEIITTPTFAILVFSFRF